MAHLDPVYDYLSAKEQCETRGYTYLGAVAIVPGKMECLERILTKLLLQRRRILLTHITHHSKTRLKEIKEMILDFRGAGRAYKCNEAIVCSVDL